MPNATAHTMAKTEETGSIPRAQSSLELLSQTAAVVEERSTGVVSEHTSPSYPSARVTPADTANLCSTLALPDMTQAARSAVSLEQKRSSFLPPALHFENGAVENGAVATDLEASPFQPGLFLSYSNVSSGTTARTAPTENPPASVCTVSDAGEAAGGTGVPSAPSFLASTSFSSSATGGTAPVSSVRSASQQPQQQPQVSSMQSVFVPPRYGGQRLGGDDEDYDLVRENLMLRQQLAGKDATVEGLQKQVESLQQQIRQMRQQPTGKISQIPLEDMLAIMREYGSEVSETAIPPRKTYVQRASVVRQFRRWNPNFLKWFEFTSGSWRPKLGRDAELLRRQEARRLAALDRKRNKQSNPSDDDTSF